MSEVEVTQVDQEEYPEMHRVLELALEAGRILLRNGAEIFRVEETIEHNLQKIWCGSSGFLCTE